MEEKLKSIELHAILSALNLFPYWLIKRDPKLTICNVSGGRELTISEIKKEIEDFMEYIQTNGINECFQDKGYDFFKHLR